MAAGERRSSLIYPLVAVLSVVGSVALILRFVVDAVLVLINDAIPYVLPVSPAIHLQVPTLTGAPLDGLVTSEVTVLLAGLEPSLQVLLILVALLPTALLASALSRLARVSLALRSERPFSGVIARSLQLGASFVLAAGVLGGTLRLWTDRIVAAAVFGPGSNLVRPELGMVDGGLILVGLFLLLAAIMVTQAERIQQDSAGLI